MNFTRKIATPVSVNSNDSPVLEELCMLRVDIYLD